MGSARGSGVVKSGLGNSGGWGRGPSVFGLLLKKGQCLENYMFIMQALLNFENIAYRGGNNGWYVVGRMLLAS